ncbi:MAG: heparin lyase I family protein, partial [Bacteroidota bacterium]
MKNSLIIFLLLLPNHWLLAQVTCSADADSGSGYPAIVAAGMGIENPDCVHGDFGPHITQSFDDALQKNVFQFHSHIESDNDRCQVFDRVRMEIKGGPGTDAELQHPEGVMSYYRWKFRVSENYTGGATFHHIFQLKAKGGNDAGLPVITLTLRTSLLELRHNGGATGVDLDRLGEVDLTAIRGRWVEVFMQIKNDEAGTLEVELKDLLNGNTLLQYSSDNIDLWRTGADYNRPKWGMYRSKAAGLADEVFKFADFCVSESAASLCPADDTVRTDEVAPTVPENLTASDVLINSLQLSWDASSDAFGVSQYEVFQDGQKVWEGTTTSTLIENLTGSTQYSFTVVAIDAAGNRSAPSAALLVTTDSATALPTAPSNPSPADGAVIGTSQLSLNWTAGENVDTTKIYFGTSSTATDFKVIAGDSYGVTLPTDTQYYWQVQHVNANGTTQGPLWSFTK